VSTVVVMHAPADVEANRATVARLMTILDGQTPVAAGAEFIHPDVVANFDGWRFRGINLWANWIVYLRTRPHLAELRLVVDRIDSNPDGTVSAHGHWNALRDGRPVFSGPGVARYRFEGGKIVEIWTTRHNYLLHFGPWLRYRWGLVWMLYQLGVWKGRVPQLDLRAAAAPASAPAHPRDPMSTTATSAPSAATGAAMRFRDFTERLNGPWHRRAMWAFLAIVLAHWAEHLLQAYQIWALGMPRHQALGALGMLWPWLVHSEWLHYGYALVMLAGLFLLWPGMTGRARTWWSVALAIQFWHHVEHGLLLAQALGGWRLGGGPAPSSMVQLLVPRVELHLFYNAVVFVPMVVAMAYHLYPSPEERAKMTCSCALHRAAAAA
jgi:hypothetical protein